MKPPTIEQEAIVTLAITNCQLRQTIRDLQEEYQEEVTRLRMQIESNWRRSRPYEGNLYKELRHAVHRWRSMRRRR